MPTVEALGAFPVPCAQLDASGCVVQASQTLADLLSIHTEALVGRMLADFVVIEDLELYSDCLAKALAGENSTGTVCCIRANSTTLCCKVYMAPANSKDTVQVALVDLSEHSQWTERALHREALLETVAYAAQNLLRSPSWGAQALEILGRIGKSAAASQVYLYSHKQFAQEYGQFHLEFAWADDNATASGTAPLDLERCYKRWKGVLAKSHSIHGTTDSFPEAEQAMLRERQIASIAIVPIFAGHTWWGFLGLDFRQRRQQRHDDIESLRLLANLFGASIQRTENEAKLARQQLHLESILGEQTSALTKATQELAQEAKSRQRTQQALQHEREFIQYVLEAEPNPVFVKSATGQYLLTNSVLMMLVNESDFPGIDPDTRRATGNSFPNAPDCEKRVLERHETITTEEVYTAADKTQRWFRVTRLPLAPPNGPTHILGIAIDITEQREADALREQLHESLQSRVNERTAELRTSEERLELALSAARLGIWDVRFDAQTVLLDFHLTELLGLTPDHKEMSLAQWYVLLHPEDHKKTLKAQALSVLELDDRFNAQFRMRHADGSWRWFQSNGRVVKRDQQGAPLRAVGTLMDVTAQKSALRALRLSERRYRQLVETMTDGLCLFDEKGRITYANERFMQMLQRPLKEVLGNSIDRYVVESSCIVGALRPPLDCECEAVLLASDDIRVPVLMARTPMHDADGNCTGAFAIFTDITARKRNENIMAALLELSQFLNRAAGLQEGLDFAVNAAMRLAPVDCAGVLIEDLQSAQLRLHLAKGLTEQQAGALIELPYSLQPASHENSGASPSTGRQIDFARIERVFTRAGIHAVGLSPICDGTSRTVILWAGSNTLGALPQDTTEALNTMANTVTATLGRIRAMEALRESEDKLQRIFQEAPDIIMIVDAAAGHILRTNRTAQRVLGYREQDLIGRHILSLAPQASGNSGERILDEIRVKDSVFECVDFRRADGAVCPMDVTASLITWGTEEVILVTLRDVTERRRAEDALRASEQLHRTIVEATLEGIMMVDEQERIIYLNRRMAEMLGYTPQEMHGACSYQFFPPDMNHAAQRHFAIRKLGKCEQYDFCWQHRAGHLVWTINSSAPLYGPQHEFVGALILVTDVTERRQAAEETKLKEQQLVQADKMASLGILVSGVAHEINNPNHFIMSNAQVLARAWRDLLPILDEYHEENGDFVVGGLDYAVLREEFPAVLKRIEDGSRRIGRIVHELRSYTRQSTTDLSETVDLRVVVRSAQTLLANMLKKHTHHFSTAIPERLPCIRGNRQRMEQVVINLIQNSCQALASPEKAIHVRLAHLPEQHCIQLQVEDEGIGVSPEALPRVLDPFFTTKRSEGGTGLGLAISSKIVEEHGGTLDFQSTQGQGTVVTVSLPLPPEDGNHPSTKDQLIAAIDKEIPSSENRTQRIEDTLND